MAITHSLPERFVFRRTIYVEVDRRSWGKKAPPPGLLALDGRPFQLDVLEMMTEIGRVTAPVGGYGFELSTRWPWLRYLPALDDGPELRLRAEWSDLDSHQKMILSDDFGMGLPITILKHALGAEAFPTQYVVKRLVPQLAHIYAQPAGGAKRGPNKSPDFVALDGATSEVHILECKGTQASRGAMLGSIRKPGLEQKKAIEIEGAPVGQRLVGGVYVPEAYGAGAAVCRFVDPEPEEPVRIAASRGELDRLSVDFEIAGALHLMDAPPDVESVTGRRPTTSLRERIGARRETWIHEEFAGEHFLVASRQVNFPAERVEDGVRVRGVRMKIGLPNSTVAIFEKARADAPLTETTSPIGRRPGRKHVRDDRRFAEVSRAGVFVSAELLTAND